LLTEGCVELPDGLQADKVATAIKPANLVNEENLKTSIIITC